MIYDHLIVGAGLSGCSIAYWLKQKDPSSSRLLLDTKGLAAEASSANAGFLTTGSLLHFHRLVQQHGSEVAIQLFAFRQQNHQLLREQIHVKTLKHLKYRAAGSLSVATSDETLGKIEAASRALQGLGYRCRPIDSERLSRRYNLTGFKGGAMYPGDASVHPQRLVEWIFRLSQTPLKTHTGVQKLEPEDRGWVVSTDSETFRCRHLYVAVNAFMPRLFPKIQFELIPTRGQMLSTTFFPPLFQPNVYSCDDGVYLRQTDYGQVIIGGYRSLDVEGEVGFQQLSHPRIQAALEEFIIRHLDLHPLAKRRWSGIMGWSPQGLPGAGPIHSGNHGFFMGGFSGHGMGTAFLLARHLVEFSLDRQPIPDLFFRVLQ